MVKSTINVLTIDYLWYNILYVGGMIEVKRLEEISPIDGRYYRYTEKLKDYFSEYAYIKYRFNIEIDWLEELNSIIGVVERKKLEKQLLTIKNDFSLKGARRIKVIEKKTNHDVKAIEYYIRKVLKNSNLEKLEYLVHFGLTSEDVNNLAISKMLKDFLDDIFLNKVNELLKQLRIMKENYRDITMLSHTHGQPATPTTVGKELSVYIYRIETVINIIKTMKLRGKFSGAVGNFAALKFAYPEEKWLNISERFVENQGLEFNPLTTQIESHDILCIILNLIKNLNNIIYDLNQDMWLYISNNYFKLKVINKEVGSSVMPHKVNPINFENSMANLKLSSSLIDSLVDNLQISRMQRDLSDSSLQRNIGVIFGYFLIGINQTIIGLEKCEINYERINEDLNNNPEVLAEAIQTVLRKNKDTKAYEKLKKVTRGKKISLNDLRKYIKKLNIDEEDKNRLLNLRVESYIGLSRELSDLV